MLTAIKFTDIMVLKKYTDLKINIRMYSKNSKNKSNK